MAIDATSRKAQPAAQRVQDSAMQAVFMLLRAAGDAL
jgi:diacylglycerol kinase